jgi:hypothetical protein
MNVEYINPFTQATFDVLSMFGTFDPKLEKPALAGESLLSEGIAVVVGIIGEVKGQVVYTYSEDTAKAIASTMMMGMPVETFDEMAKVIEKYIIGTLDLSEYDNPNATMEKAMDLFKMNRHEEEKASDLGKTDEVRIQ